jgi:hypothetical protein
MPDEAVERAVTAFAEYWRSLTATTAAGFFAVRNGVMRVVSGIPGPAFNGVWGTGSEIEADDVLAAAKDFVAGPVAWNVQLRPGYPPELDAALAELGLVINEQIPLMLLRDGSALPGPSRLVIRRLTTFADTDTALRLLEQGFGMPPEMTRETIPLAMLFVAGAATWIAADGGVDVSTALSVVTDRVCGIFNVATPAALCGKGYGAAVAAASLRDAWDAGCDLAYLQSTGAGYGIYERLGFVTVERWTQWVPSEYIDADPHEDELER